VGSLEEVAPFLMEADVEALRAWGGEALEAPSPVAAAG
jgi:hypothetical protein